MRGIGIVITLLGLTFGCAVAVSAWIGFMAAIAINVAKWFL